MTNNEKMCKMFLGGLNRSTVDETLKEYFSRWGTVSDFVVIRDSEKNSRGFGFVTLSAVDEVDAVLAEKPHTIDGKEVEVKRAIPRDEQSETAHERTNKVFIGGLAKNVTEQDVKDFFAKPEFNVGVDSVDLIYDKETKEFRGFGFMTLANEDMADKLSTMRMFLTPYGEKKWEVKKATKRSGPGGERGGGRGGGRGRGAPRGGPRGGGGGGYGGNFNSGGSYGGPGAYNSGSYGGSGGYGSVGYGNSYGSGGGMEGYGSYAQTGYSSAGYDSYGGAAAGGYGYDSTGYGSSGPQGPSSYDNYGGMGSYNQPMTNNYGPSRGGRGSRYKPY